MDISSIAILLLISLIGFSAYNITNSTNGHKKIIAIFNAIFLLILLLILLLAYIERNIVDRDGEKYQINGDSFFSALHYVDTKNGRHEFSESAFLSPSIKVYVYENVKLPLITRSRLNTKVRIYYLNGNAVKICPNFTDWYIEIFLIDFFVLYVFNFINFFIVLGKKINRNSKEE